MQTNPKPKPVIIVTAGDGAIISRDANRPGASVGTQAFKSQAGMRGILQEFLKSFAGGFADLRRQAVVQFPEIFRAARVHFLGRSDLSFSARKFSGFCEYSASSLSRREESDVRGALS